MASVLYDQNNLSVRSALYSQFNDAIFISWGARRDFYSVFVEDKFRSIENKANSNLNQPSTADIDKVVSKSIIFIS